MRISDWSSDVCSSDLQTGSGRGHTSARDRIRALARVAIDIPKDTNPGARDGQGRPQDRQGQALQLQLRQRPYARGHQGDRRSFGPGGEEGRDEDDQGTGEEGRGQEDRRQGVGARTAGVNEKPRIRGRSEEHTSELQSLMRISYAVFCLKKKTQTKKHTS